MTTETIPAPDLAAFRQFCNDGDYLTAIWAQVRKQHPDSYVAAYKGEIVAAHKTLKGILAEMDNKGVPKNHAVLRYVSRKPRRMVL